MPPMLQITAPHFCAGLIVEDGKVTEAAPILKWAIGKTDNELRAYCARKSWRVREISEHPAQNR